MAKGETMMDRFDTKVLLIRRSHTQRVAAALLKISIGILTTESRTSTLQEFIRDLSYLYKRLCCPEQSDIFHNYTAYDPVQNVSCWSNLCPKIHGPKKLIIYYILKKASIVVVFTVQRF